MTFTPVLASDTTAAFLFPFVVLFWVVIGGSTIAGLLSLTLYGCKRVQKYVGVILGLLSTAAGAGGVMFFLLFTEGVGLLGWGGVVTPLLIGVLALILWKNRKQYNKDVA